MVPYTCNTSNKQSLILIIITNNRLINLFSACAQRQLKKRGSKTLMGLERLLRQFDREGDGQINRVELEKALLDFHIDIPQEVC